MSCAWEREVSAQIREVVGGAPLVAVMWDGGAPTHGVVDGARLAAGRIRPTTPSPLADGRLPCADATQPAILVSFVGGASTSETREQLLAEVRRVLAPGGRLLVLDHNRPRGRLAALGAVITAPVPPGASLAARWRRLSYTTAREAQARGLVVEALRLAVGERVQLVVARAGDTAATTPPEGV